MKKYARVLLAYTLSTVSGLCLIGGIAILTAGR